MHREWQTKSPTDGRSTPPAQTNVLEPQTRSRRAGEYSVNQQGHKIGNAAAAKLLRRSAECSGAARPLKECNGTDQRGEPEERARESN